MNAALAMSLPVADHPGSLVLALPFFTPALLIAGGLVVMRLRERRRQDSGDG